MSSLPSGTVTFLFTDIEGSTKLAQKHPEKWELLRERHHSILRGAIEANHGYVFQIIGDAFCVAFHTAGDGLNAAVEAQRKLQNEDWGNAPIKVRMGIHTGKAELQGDGQYYGYLAMSRVQRLMSAAYGGQALISLATEELLRDDLPADVSLRDMGEHRLKDLIYPEHIFQVDVPDLPSEFPALKTIDAQMNKLPMQLTPFIGRERDITAVLGLIRNPDVHLVTLTGSGGTGKTRLSLQVAAELLDEFQHGVWFVDLAPITNPGLVVAEIASVVGVKESSDEPLDKTLLQYLRGRSMLLVLDNYEQVIAAAPVVSQLLTGAPHLKVLVTSREVLQVYGEHSYHVPPLTTPDLHRKETAVVISQYEAVLLFIQRAKAAKPSFEINNGNALAVAEICVRLDGLPLAVELASARIALFAPQQLLQRLTDRLKTVSGGQRDLPGRQRTLRATIDWSYDLLSEDEKILFAGLSVFQGGCTLEAVETVCSEALGIEVADGLESLIHKSLLRQVSGSTDESRYMMLETIHEYARERLAASAESDAVRVRHVKYFAQLAEHAELDIQRGEYWRLILNDEQDNILAALEWSLSGSVVTAGVLLATSIAGFWFGEGHHSLNDIWIPRALQYQDLLPREGRARLLLQAGLAAWSTYDMERARQFDLQALDLFRELDNALMTANTLIYLAGTTMGYPDLYSHAKVWLEEALQLTHQVKDTTIEARAFMVLGEVARSIGDYATAKKAYEDCLPLTRQAGHRLMETMVLSNFSHVYSHEGDHHRAYDFAQQTLQLGIEINSVAMIAEALNRLARAIGPLGQPERAARLYGASEALREKLGARIQAGDLADYEHGLAAARAMLDPAQFSVLWAEGQAMDMEQAIAYALELSTDR